MIKARAAAGDQELGAYFLSRLTPYIWRKYLDYAAINDIQSLKRQIHAVKGHGQITVPGHNIKLGRGGIREIEFFVQTQQLIAGGRNETLRGKGTLAMLAALCDAGWIKEQTAVDLHDAYIFLRTLEHRLQMVDDQQVHTLPEDQGKLLQLALFSGFENVETFSNGVTEVLETVQNHYDALFEEADALGGDSGNLVFTGGDDDPETIETLSRLGYHQPSEISATIRGWHFGRYAATRSATARERLTELVPTLVTAFSKAADPDKAFLGFDKLLAGLPAGVAVFAMLKANPQLLDLISAILGTAPRLAVELAQRPRILDAVLEPDFFSGQPDRSQTNAAIEKAISRAQGDFESGLDQARIIGREYMFRIGVRIMSETLSAAKAGRAYSDLADILIKHLLVLAENDLATRHGHIPGGKACIVAMGKLGGRELNAASDLDLILIYDHPEDVTQSDGPKPISPSKYYARLTQRLISALTAPTAEGMLYEVDMRLRPSGNKGPVANRLASFIDYHNGSAWTWEKLALTRARVIGDTNDLSLKVAEAVKTALVERRDIENIEKDVADMREILLRERGNKNIWNLKHVAGGMVDVEFITQYLQIAHASEKPEILAPRTTTAIKNLIAHDVLAVEDGEMLLAANRLYHRQTHILKLCLEEDFEKEAPDWSSHSDGLRVLMCNAAAVPDMPSLESLLSDTQKNVADLFNRTVRKVH